MFENAAAPVAVVVALAVKTRDARRVDGLHLGIGRAVGFAGSACLPRSRRPRRVPVAHLHGEVAAGQRNRRDGGAGRSRDLADLIGAHTLRQVDGNGVADIGADLVGGHAAAAVRARSSR